MPKFTQEELEEIRRNTDQIEYARRAKETKSQKPKKAKNPRKKKDAEYSLSERLLPLLLLGVTLGVSYLVVLFF
jgi:F0F1-type ATP synthase assembly protein I